MRSIRRKEKEISDKAEMVRILMEADHVTIAMCDVDGPYLATLTHGYAEKKNALYFHCADKGRKVDILLRDNRIWGQALVDLGYVDGKCDHLYATTQFKGRVTFVEDQDEKRFALETMIRQHEKDPDRVIAAQLTKSSIERVNIGRIDIESLSGKRSDKVVVSL